MPETISISNQDIVDLSKLAYYEADVIRAYYQNEGYSSADAMKLACGHVVQSAIRPA